MSFLRLLEIPCIPRINLVNVGIVMCRGISLTDHKWYPATIRGHACAEDEKLRSLSQSERNIVHVICCSRYSAQVLYVQISMSFIRLLEIPCTGGLPISARRHCLIQLISLTATPVAW